ncbi:MAG: CoA transferase [Anaerolineales bacterium]|nr:CoA transferase [Anaerolineales bacterium]
MSALEGVRVIDLTRAMAGPYCTMMLADLGADVIKIERPRSGDESRGWGPPFVGPPAENAPGESAYFLSVNRNKRSITLNLKSEQGLEVVQRLISKSDILVENFRTGVLDEMGLGVIQAQKVNPALIYCSISGYGRTGPYADRPGYDVIIQAEGGMMGITGPKEGPPSRVGVPIVDITSGMFAASSILAALHARQRTGRGQHIDVSLFDTQTALLTNVAANYLIGGQPPERMGNDHPNLAPYAAFPASDKWFVVGVANEMQWERFCKVIGQPDLQVDPRFRTNGDRVQHRDELSAILEEKFSQRKAQDWLASFMQAGLPCGPINDIGEVFEHPQVEARRLIIESDHPSAGTLRLTGFPYKLSDTPPALRLPPPRLGEHTEDVLVDLLGYQLADLSAFRQNNAI